MSSSLRSYSQTGTALPGSCENKVESREITEREEQGPDPLDDTSETQAFQCKPNRENERENSSKWPLEIPENTHTSHNEKNEKRANWMQIEAGKENRQNEIENSSKLSMEISENTPHRTDDNTNGEGMRSLDEKHEPEGRRETGQQRTEDIRDGTITNKYMNDSKHEDGAENCRLQAAKYEEQPETFSQNRQMEEKVESETDSRSEEKKPGRSHKEKNEDRAICVQIEAGQERKNREHIDLLRRSEEAGLLMRQGNPNITDLSDTNRPTKLAERFSELYSNEHTDAFEELQMLNIDEKTSVSILLNIIKGAYSFCSEKAEAERKLLLDEFQTDIKNEKIKRALVANRLKEKATEIGTTVCKNFCDDKFPKIIQAHFKGTSQKLNIFAKDCVDIVWLMCVQDPPIFMEWEDDDVDMKFNSEKYRSYTKSGKMIDFYVWPVVYLCEGGGLVLKGIAQGK